MNWAFLSWALPSLVLWANCGSSVKWPEYPYQNIRLFFTILLMRHLQETGDRLFIQGIHIGLIIKPDIIA